MIDYELIRHEFIMTEDAMPIPVIQKKRKQLTSTKIRICNRCGNMFSGPMRGGKCVNCYEYKIRTGKNRPKKFWQKSILCSNPDCRRLLSEDKYAKRFFCNACFVYEARHGIQRPLELCEKYERQQNV